jgi:hypothetical protein
VPLVTVVIDASLSSNAPRERRPPLREKARGANELFDAPAGLVLDPVAAS